MTASEIKTVYRPKGICFWQRRRKYAEGPVVNGKKEGKWVYWYQNGQKQMEGEYIEGKKNGTWLKWHENGKKQIEGEFIKDAMHGRWTCWYGSGQKQMDGSRVYGKKDGTWTYWKESPGSDEPVIEKVEAHDHRAEKKHDSIMLTDMELKRMISQRFREIRQGEWERMVGRPIGRIVKRWHALFFVLALIPVYAVMEPYFGWRALPLAVAITVVATIFLEVFFGQRPPDGDH